MKTKKYRWLCKGRCRRSRPTSSSKGTWRPGIACESACESTMWSCLFHMANLSYSLPVLIPIYHYIHGRQSGLELFKTVQQTGLHPTAPAFIAWQNFSQVIKTGICRPIGTHTRKRHLQTAFVHARLGRQLTCLRHLSFDLSWVLPGSSVSRDMDRWWQCRLGSTWAEIECLCQSWQQLQYYK